MAAQIRVLTRRVRTLEVTQHSVAAPVKESVGWMPGVSHASTSIPADVPSIPALEPTAGPDETKCTAPPGYLGPGTSF